MSREITERNSATQAILQVGRDPELERLLRMRLLAIVFLFVIALGWHWIAAVRLPMLVAATVGSAVVTLGAVFVLRKRPLESLRVAELHVAADLVIMPAFTLATGGWESPFVAILVAKPVSSALLVGRKRGTWYGLGVLVAAVCVWVIDASLRLGSTPEAILPPIGVGLILGVLGAVMMQAASLPMDAYRDRRKQLVSENRRLEEAIGELEVQNQRLTALHVLSGTIGTLGTMTEVVGKLRDAVQTTFPGRHASFFFYRREQGRLDPIALAPGVDPARAALLALPEGQLHRAMGGTISGETTPPGGALRTNDGEKLDLHAVSQVTVALHLAGRPIGVLVLESRSPYPFDEDDRKLLVTMGNEMAVALRNAELNTRSKQLWEFQQSLIDNANAIILVVDATGALEIANPAFHTIVEPLEEPVGRRLELWLSPRSAEDWRAALAAAMAGAPVENVRLDLRAAGTERRVVFNLAPVRDRSVKTGTFEIPLKQNTPASPLPKVAFRHVIAVGQDITRVELLEREIAHTEKLASLGTFVAGIAHEMNNPLTAIINYGGMVRHSLKKGDVGQDSLDKLDDIVFAGERIHGFVQSLLGFARPAGGVRPDLDLNGVLRDAIRLCHVDLKKSNLDVHVELAAEVPPVKGIEAELQQVFINLFTNAAHASPASGGRLTVATSRTDSGVRITVSDNGHGIPPEVLPRIFEAFYSTKAEGKGSGLGLSIVKRIIEQHRGTIEVESAIGKGTTFILSIPHATAERSQPEAPSRPKVGAGGS